MDSTGNRSLSDIDVSRLKGVGPNLRERLARLEIHSLQDLLFHLPSRYQDRSRVTPIGQSRLGQDLVLEGEIISCAPEFGRRRSLLCRIRDDSGIIGLRFFHFSAAQKNSLQPGRRLRCFGEIRSGRTGYEVYHPEYQFVEDLAPGPEADYLTPIYPTTEGMQQLRLRKLTALALQALEQDGGLTEHLPAALLQKESLLPLAEAVRFLHRPPVDANIQQLQEGLHPTQRRLAFEELLAHRLCLRQIRHQSRQCQAPVLTAKRTLTHQFLKKLPFPLTAAQARVAREIGQDISEAAPMLRLLQGDVGSGKTVVAALAALQAVENGYQVAIMAPTELLAEQHFLNFSQWLEPLGLQIGWLSGRIKGRKRDEQLTLMSTGNATIAIGTHALFQDDVQFRRLGLVIIDEQHRFGVHQRLALREKGVDGNALPHQLVMTATPIPRTLAMSAYADLEVSVIDELPPGRTPVNTLVVDNCRRSEVIERIHQACSQDKQAYWVCTLIEESEALQCQAAEVTADQLREQLPDLRVALVHGRMKPREKTDVMDAFKRGEYQLLVATTVIEVGVDVPNASLMVIENPERLGLAQLHQLRGRVGRGQTASHCLLMYQAPLSRTARERLAIMRDSNDGFLIAEQDLKLRGPGQVLGTRQTGLMDFRIADLIRDEDLLEKTLPVSEDLLQHHPDSVTPLIKRWLGNRELYAGV